MNKRTIRIIDAIYWSIILITTLILVTKQEIINIFPILEFRNISQIKIIIYSFFYSFLLNWITTIMYIGIRIAIKKHYKQKMNIIDLKKYKSYYRELIQKYSPAVLNYIDNFNVDKNTIIATIMSLELKGFIDENMNIIKKDVSQLEKNEEFIYSNIKNLKQIEINEFYKCIIDDCEKYKLIKEKKLTEKEFDKENEKAVIIVAIIVFGFILSIVINKPIMGLITFFIGIIGYIITFSKNMTTKIIKEVDPYVRTKHGEKINEKLEGLKNYLQDYSSIKEKTADELVIWEDYLIYSVILNQNDKIIKEYEKKIDL